MSDKVQQFGEIRDKDGNVLVQMFGPGRSDDAVSMGLRMLTHRLQLAFPENDQGGGFFGGQFGYGVDFENDTFLMHHYCWCDKNDGSCLWCLHGDHPDFIRLLGDRFGTTDANYYDKQTHYFDPPHFWHKPSNFRVIWYKYIGRDNAFNREIGVAEWQSILRAVLESIGAPSLEQCVDEFVKAEASGG